MKPQHKILLCAHALIALGCASYAAVEADSMAAWSTLIHRGVSSSGDSSSSSARAAIVSEAAKQNVPIAFVDAIASQESRYRLNAVGPNTRYGHAHCFMQLLPSTAKQLGFTGSIEQLHDPATCAHYGVMYAAMGLTYAHGDLAQAAKFYHGGPNQHIWGNKTQRYAREVLARMGTPQVAEVKPEAKAILSAISFAPNYHQKTAFQLYEEKRSDGGRS